MMKLTFDLDLENDSPEYCKNRIKELRRIESLLLTFCLEKDKELNRMEHMKNIVLGKCNKAIRIEDIKKSLNGFLTEEEVDLAVRELLREGDVYNSREGYIERI